MPRRGRRPMRQQVIRGAEGDKPTARSSRYEEIALGIAESIVRGAYPEGSKISGRSTLAGTYQVSPETIRRSIALLHSRGVLEAQPGRGIFVLSAAKAREFVEEWRIKADMEALEGELLALRADRERIDRRIGEIVEQILAAARKTIWDQRKVEEIEVPVDSPLVGQTLGEARLRSRTGATVVAVTSGGEEIFGPGPDVVLHPGAVLVVTGSDEARARLRDVLRLGETQ